MSMLSITNRLSALSMARANGPSNPTAKVVRTPSGVNLSMLLPSTTNRLPALSKARPNGPGNPRAKVVRTPSGGKGGFYSVRSEFKDLAVAGLAPRHKQVLRQRAGANQKDRSQRDYPAD